MLVTHKPVESSLIQEPNHNKSVHLAIGDVASDRRVWTTGSGSISIERGKIREGRASEHFDTVR
jgi:hypothetical protein